MEDTISDQRSRKLLSVKMLIHVFSYKSNFRCSKELPNQDGSFEYPKHMFWREIKKIIILNQEILSAGLQIM